MGIAGTCITKEENDPPSQEKLVEKPEDETTVLRCSAEQ
jgi:hypothetical protein